MRFSLVLMLSLLHPGSRAVAQRTAPPACTETPDHATATVLQHWYRTQDMAGAARRVETNAVQDEHWVRTAGGWKRGDIGEISQGASFVDGKRVDITKPYDPDAPPYDPSAASSPR